MSLYRMYAARCCRVPSRGAYSFGMGDNTMLPFSQGGLRRFPSLVRPDETSLSIICWAGVWRREGPVDPLFTHLLEKTHGRGQISL